MPKKNVRRAAQQQRRANNTAANKKMSSEVKGKATKQKKVQLDEADKLLQLQGQRGTDIRSPVGDSTIAVRDQQVVAGSNGITAIKCTYTDRAISDLAAGIVLKAMRHGYKWSDSSFGDCPYYAFRYLITIIKSAMNGTIPQIQQAPMWFWCLLYAIKQKTVNFKTAQVKYSWVETLSGESDDVAFTLGTGPDAYTLFWGVTGSSTINEIPVLAAPPAYDPTTNQGATALNQMFSFYSGAGSGALVGDPGKTPFDYDTSAFAACYAEMGSSFFTPGGLKTTFYSERQVDSPVLSKIAEYQDGPWRGWQKAGVTGGSTFYTGGRISELKMDTWRNKTPPIFKIFNFDEYFEVLSLCLCLALENANSNVLPNVKPCPLTPLQVQLLLRQSLVPFFHNELAQDLRFAGPNFVDMLPMTVGPNGASYGRQSMMVPTFLAENIRCCRRITHKLKTTRGKSDRQVIDVIPILCRSPEKAQLGQYVYGDALNPLYATGLPPPLVEVPVNLIDLSATELGVTSYLDLNTEPFGALVTAWNEWIQTLQPVLSPLVNLSPAPGVAALSTVVYSNFQRNVVLDVPLQQNGDRVSQPIGGNGQTTKSVPPERSSIEKRSSNKKNETFHIGGVIPRRRLGAAPAVGSSYFDTVGDTTISSVLGFNSALYPYISLWILPINWSTTGAQDATPQALQTFQCEATFLDRSSSNNSAGLIIGANKTPSAYERHKLMASVDVKGVTQDGNHELIQGLVDLAKRGEGGFFTSVASMIGDAFGVPAVRGIATAIGNVTGL